MARERIAARTRKRSRMIFFDSMVIPKKERVKKEEKIPLAMTAATAASRMKILGIPCKEKEGWDVWFWFVWGIIFSFL